MRAIRVVVVEEHEIFRLGLVAALGADARMEVVLETDREPVPGDIDVAVVSPRVAAERRFDCPVVVSSADAGPFPIKEGNLVCAVLSRGRLTADQLTATVRAAVAGLRVLPSEQDPSGRLDARSVQVLRLLAGGADTTEISHSLRYSPRTIKSCISGIERRLGARNRTQAVAEGIRRGII